MDSNWGEGQGRPWYSTDGRYMCGIDVGKGPLAWVIDTSDGRVVVRKRVKTSGDYSAKWRDGSFFIHTYGEKKPLAVLKADQTPRAAFPEWVALLARSRGASVDLAR